jgi:hypothetical protein
MLRILALCPSLSVDSIASSLEAEDLRETTLEAEKHIYY